VKAKSGVRTRRSYLALASLWLIIAHLHAGTLKELLLSEGVPVSQFSPFELSETVQGDGNGDQQQTLLAYRRIRGELLVGPLRLLRYNKIAGTVLRSEGGLAEDDVCLGSIESISFVGSFTLLATSISPSAACLLVIGDDLHVRHTLYGFAPVEVSRNNIVLIENMIHFAPVHPERLLQADLESGENSELYPLKHDPLRRRLIREHKKLMPAEKTCALNNDPCVAAEFDEDIRALNTDGKGLFAFLAMQSASHSTRPESTPTTFVSQSVLYVYRRDPAGWHYCERSVSSPQVDAVSGLLRSNFSEVAHRCIPTSPVVVDSSTLGYNPTPNH